MTDRYSLFAPKAPSEDEYEEVSTLPQAAALTRRFIASERHWSRQHMAGLDSDGHLDYMRSLDDFSALLDRATAIWHEEQAAVRQRIADRIRAEIPDAEGANIPQAIERNDYTLMAC